MMDDFLIGVNGCDDGETALGGEARSEEDLYRLLWWLLLLFYYGGSRIAFVDKNAMELWCGWRGVRALVVVGGSEQYLSEKGQKTSFALVECKIQVQRESAFVFFPQPTSTPSRGCLLHKP